MWPFSTIRKLKTRAKEAENLLAKSLTDGLKLEDFKSRGGETGLALSGSPLHLFAEAFVGQFVESGATNYLEMKFVHKGSNEPYTVLMQRDNGLSPSQKNKALKELLERSVNGLVWYRSAHPESWSEADEEHLAECYKLLTN